MKLDINRLKKNIETDAKKAKIKLIHDRIRQHRYIPYNTKEYIKNIKQCQHPKCTETTRLEVHHKIPISRGGKNNIENLIVLCHKHHIDADREIGVERYQL